MNKFEQTNPQWRQSLEEILLHTTGIEVRTVIVPEMTYHVFDPLQTYREIYDLQTERDASTVHLRRQLQLEYQYLLQDPNSGISETMGTSLPSPENISICQKLCQNQRFLRKLRQLSTIKQLISENQTYAQTLIELEGNITHKYHQKLLEHPQQQLILELHHRGVEASQKQWRGILSLIWRLLS